MKKIIVIALLLSAGLIQAQQQIFSVVPTEDLPQRIAYDESKIVDFTVTNNSRVAQSGIFVPPYPASEFPLPGMVMRVPPEVPDAFCNRALSLLPGQSCTLSLRLPLPGIELIGQEWFRDGNFQVCSTGACAKQVLGSPSGWTPTVINENVPLLVASPEAMSFSIVRPGEVSLTNENATTSTREVKIDFVHFIRDGKIQATVDGIAVPPNPTGNDTALCQAPLTGEASCDVVVTSTEKQDFTFAFQVTGIASTGETLTPLNVPATYSATGHVIAVGDACYAGFLKADGDSTWVDGTTHLCPAGLENAYLSAIASDDHLLVATVGFASSVADTILVGSTHDSPPWTTPWQAVTLANATRPYVPFSPEAVDVNGTHWVFLGFDQNKDAPPSKVMVSLLEAERDGHLDGSKAVTTVIAEGRDTSIIQRLIWNGKLHLWIGIGTRAPTGSKIYVNPHPWGAGRWTVLDVPGSLLFDISCKEQTLNEEPVCLAVGTNLATGAAMVLQTQEGRTWLADESINALNYPGLNAVANNGSEWLVGGIDQKLATKVAGQWKPAQDVVAGHQNFFSLTWNGSQWLAVGTGGLAYRTTGLDATGETGWRPIRTTGTPLITQGLSY